ncbi:InlB B-repeat-containing protein [Hyalangium sp.]|uniref:InlB B-repeat-containing protein n=1 Tax=Hyalangium sp. TaxID=2028555 RepID=UPI0039C8A0E0
MRPALVAIAVVFVFALPARAVAQQQCYQTTASSKPPHAATFTPTRTSCSTTPAGACWYRVTSSRINPPPYDLWLAAPSSWNFRSCEFLSYWGPTASGDPIIWWLLGPDSCNSLPCNTQSPAAPSMYTLNVTLAGNGSGAVVSTPAGINCPAGNCSASFPAGTFVTLTATPAAYFDLFAGWSGACWGTDACPVMMSAASSVTATFTICGDGICSPNEENTCPYDCPTCGDGICNANEDSSNCYDCGWWCGDGVCNFSENYSNCTQDC